MALQDVCGSLKLLDDFNLSAHKPTWMGLTCANEFELDSPFTFHFPPQQTPGRCDTPAIFSPAFLGLSPHQKPFQLSHGTTTLGFMFQGGVIAAADTRASCQGLICCPMTQKILPVHSHLVVTTSGSGADCMLWERILTRQIRLYQLRHRRRLSINGAAKLLSMMLHPFKGTDVCVAATLCGWDGEDTQTFPASWENPSLKTALEENIHFSPIANESAKIDVLSAVAGEKTASVNQQEKTTSPPKSDLNTNRTQGQFGPRVSYVCSDGLRLKGEIISVGSGSPYAYAVLDDGWRWAMTVEEAVTLAREAVFRATRWDAYSGNNVDLFHITAHGYRRRDREDLQEEYYRRMEKEKENIKERERERQNRQDVVARECEDHSE